MTWLPHFPREVWSLMAVEFAERLGYYAVSFSLFTYCTNILQTGSETANVVMNGLYLVIPLAACLSSGLADGRLGRPRALAAALIIYAVGLVLLALSSLPVMFHHFPYGATRSAIALFALALTLFGTGYGAMKVCTNPMMADSIAQGHNARHNPGGGDLSRPCAEEEVMTGATAQGALSDATPGTTEMQLVLSQLFRWLYWVTNCGALIGILAAPILRDLDTRYVAVGSSNFAAGYYYGFIVAALSVMVGMTFFLYSYGQFVRNKPAPSFVFVRLCYRALKGRCRVAMGHALIDDGGVGRPRDWLDYAVYAMPARVVVSSFGASNLARSCSADVAPASMGAEQGRAATTEHAELLSPHAKPTPDVPAVADYQAAASLRHGVKSIAQKSPSVSTSWTKEELTCAAHSCDERQRGLDIDSANDDGAASLREAPTRLTDAELHDVSDLTARGWRDDCRATLRVCRAFVALPIYWLICNQFSTNLMYLAAAVDLPAGVPQEVFNNVNTITLLVTLFIYECYVCPYWFSAQPPSSRSRIVAGFGLMVLSMLLCCAIQAAIDGRGHYDESDAYIVATGYAKVSALWLIVPYMLQGVASAFVDTTVMEVTYVAAPERMKGTVMGLYWVASSASGFLGIIFAPVMRPQNAQSLFLCFALALAAVTLLFFVLNRPHVSRLPSASSSPSSSDERS